MIDLAPLWISLKTAIVSTFLAFVGGIAVAYIMFILQPQDASPCQRSQHCLHGWQGGTINGWQGWVDGLLTLPLILPPTVVGFLLLMLLGRNGPIGHVFASLGITLLFSWSATVIASTIVAFPLMYKAVLGAFRQVDRSLLDSARILGASEWRVFCQILLPLAGPGVIAGTVLAFARALGEFGATLMLAGSIPGKTETMPMAIFFAGEAGRLEESFMWTLILVGIALGAIVSLNLVAIPGRRGEGGGFWILDFGRRRERGSTERWLNVSVAGSAAPGGRRFWILDGLISLLGGARPRREFNRTGGSCQEGEGNGQVSGSHSPAGAGHWRRWSQRLLTLESLEGIFNKLNKPNKPEETRIVSDFQMPNLTLHLCKVLSDITLSIQFTTDERPVAILGASGSGKSTLLRCVAGLTTPDDGRILLNGRVLFDAQTGVNLPVAQRRVGIVFQNYALFPHMTVAENIAFGLYHLPQAEQRHRLLYYLNLFQIKSLAHGYPLQLSGGQQQRVALARAIAPHPDILLLDEPLSALDAHLRDRLQCHLSSLFASCAGPILLVTHNVAEAYRLCDRWLVLSNGTISADGPKQVLCDRPPTYAVAQMTQCKNLSRIAVVESVKGETIRAIDWHNILLQLPEPLNHRMVYVGIHPHHVRILLETSRQHSRMLDESYETNVFPGRIVSISETQHQTIVYLSFHLSCTDTSHCLQAQVSKEMGITLYRRWTTILDGASCHCWVMLNMQSLILMEG